MNDGPDDLKQQFLTYARRAFGWLGEAGYVEGRIAMDPGAARCAWVNPSVGRFLELELAEWDGLVLADLGVLADGEVPPVRVGQPASVDDLMRVPFRYVAEEARMPAAERVELGRFEMGSVADLERAVMELSDAVRASAADVLRGDIVPLRAAGQRMLRAIGNQ